MSIVAIIISILFFLVCVALITTILLQSDRASGFSATFAAASETFWGKNKGRSIEGALEKYTKIGAGIYVVFALVLNFVM